MQAMHNDFLRTPSNWNLFNYLHPKAPKATGEADHCVWEKVYAHKHEVSDQLFTTVV